MKNLWGTLVLLVVLLSHVQSGGIPMSDHTDSSKEHYNRHWSAPEDARKRKNPLPGDEDSINRGSDLYRRHCASCHGEDAEGDGPAAGMINPRPANLRKMSGRHSDGDFAWKIENGRGPMPAWKNILSKDQVWDLVNFIQSLSVIGEVQHDSAY